MLLGTPDGAVYLLGTRQERDRWLPPANLGTHPGKAGYLRPPHPRQAAHHSQIYTHFTTMTGVFANDNRLPVGFRPQIDDFRVKPRQSRHTSQERMADWHGTLHH